MGARKDKEHNRTIPYGGGEGDRVGLTRQQISQKHFALYGRAVPDWQLRREILPMMEMGGLIRLEADQEDRRRMLIYPTGHFPISSTEEDGGNRELGGGVTPALKDELPLPSQESEDASKTEAMSAEQQAVLRQIQDDFPGSQRVE